MWKKILLSICVVLVLVIGIEIFNISKNRKEEQENIVNVVENETELSNTYVKDNCIDEWADYAEGVQEEIQEASKDLNDQNKHFILRAENDLISVYYINEKEEEILYRKTEISVEYLAEEDKEELKNGIEIEGVQNLNQLLEDFE